MSAAGKRAGIKDGTRSGLWAVFADAIDALRPRYVIIENVRGLLSATAHRAVESDDAVVGDRSDRPVLRALGAVVGDLSDIGYDARWATVSAASVGAPHRRERVFILATDADQVRSEGSGLPPTTQDGANNGGPSQFQRNTLPLNAEVTLLPTPSLSDNKTPRRGAHLTDTLENNTHTINLSDAIEYQHGRDALLCTPAAQDGNGGKTSRSGGRIDEPLLGGQDREMATAWGKYEPAIRRWEQIVGPAPAPTEPNKNGNPRLSAAFSQWLMGWPAGWVTDPAIGISRNDQLRIVGNGVCSQQAIAALRYLLVTQELEFA